VNEQILRGPREQRVRDVRVIDDEGQALGIMNVRDALAIAQEKGLDLIEVAPTAQPPVCRIMDYGKYKYEQGKRENEQRKKHKQQDIKGIKMGPVTAEHDFQVRVRHAQEFLKEGDKVKVTIQFKGRQITHPELAKRLMERMVEAITDIGIVEKPALIEGRMMTMILTPKPQGHEAKQAAQKQPQAGASAPKSAPPNAPRPAAPPRPKPAAPPAEPAPPPQAAPGQGT
jgi:translation initiation factor IF-3